MLKVKNIQNVYADSRAITTFSIYVLINGNWVHEYSTSVAGHWKRAKTVATKHCLENGVNINLNDWEF